MASSDYLKNLYNIDPTIDELGRIHYPTTYTSTNPFLNGHFNIPTDEKEPEPKEEEWIWVEGFKGTDKDMKCRDYQYELGKRFDMDEDATIEICESGFHLCSRFQDVFIFYDIGNGNRYFRVKALVRKSDFEKKHNKLVARSIEFISEFTVDEIFEAVPISEDERKDFTQADKEFAIKHNMRLAIEMISIRKLVKLGYSETFAAFLVHSGYYTIAYAVGTQEDLSMDMKAMIIFGVRERNERNDYRSYMGRRRG